MRSSKSVAIEIRVPSRPTPRVRIVFPLSTLLVFLAWPACAQMDCTPAFYISMIDSLPVDSWGMAAVSLRVDAAGQPQVAHKTYFGPVRYGIRTAEGWRVETAHPTVERNCCLMLDSSGEPHIMFRKGILSRSGNSWSLNDTDSHHIDHVGGVMASDGSAHLVVFQTFSGGMYYSAVSHVLVQGSNWNYTERGRGDFTNPNATVSIRLDANNQPRICVTNTWDPMIQCWEGIATPALPWIRAARWGSLAIDSQDTSHLAYYDTQSQDLKLAVLKNQSWSTIPVDTEGDVGAYASLAIDAAGSFHIAYYDGDARDLKYAFRTQGAATWSRCTVDETGDVGTFASLDVDAEGHVHIAYWDATTNHVKYATSRAPVGVEPTNWSRLKAKFR